MELQLSGQHAAPPEPSAVGPDRPETSVTEPRLVRRAALLPWRRIAVFAGLSGLAWVPLLLWFAAFKPGIMTGDSLGSWWQATTGNVSDDITPSYTALMKLSLVITDSPAALALGQQLLLAVSVVSVAWSLVRLGAHRGAVVVTTAVLITSPMVGAFSISIWKDIPYSACLLFCGAAVIDLVRRRLAGARGVRELQAPLLCLFVAGALAVVLRQNGLFFAGFLGIALAVALQGVRRWVLAGTAAMAIVLVSLKSIVYPVTGVDPSAEQLKYASLMHDVAAVVHHHPEALSQDDRAELESLAPIESWAGSYSCYTLNPLYYNAGLRFDALNRDPEAFRSTWLDLTLRELPTVIGHRLCAASVAWRPTAVDRSTSVLYTVSAGIDPNGDGLATTPLSDTLHRWGSSLIAEVNEPQREWYLWRAPTWIYACYAALAVAALRTRRPLILLLGAPLLAQQLGVSLINPAQDARYMMGSLMLAVLLLPVVTLPRRVAQPLRRDGAGGTEPQPRSDEGAAEPERVRDPAEPGW